VGGKEAADASAGRKVKKKRILQREDEKKRKIFCAEWGEQNKLHEWSAGEGGSDLKSPHPFSRRQKRVVIVISHQKKTAQRGWMPADAKKTGLKFLTQTATGDACSQRKKAAFPQKKDAHFEAAEKSA